MEIRVRHCYLVINCVVFIQNLEAKPFSLNEAIAEEVRGKQSLQTTPRSNSADIYEAELKENRLPVLLRKIFFSEPYLTRAAPKKKTSSVEYKNTFRIRAPIKPKRLKRQQRLLNKFKNRTAERAIDSNEVINRKYIPLFKSLSMLFDNFLNTDASESYETTTRNQLRRNYQYSENDHEQECACTFKPHANIKKIKPIKTTIATTTSIPTEIPTDDQTITSAETTADPSDYTTVGYVRSVKRNKNLPVLLTRNTTSIGRDDNGVRKRSDSTIYRSVERYLSGDNGDNECVSRNEENESSAQYYEKHPNSAPRDRASSIGSTGRIPRNRNGTRIAKTGGSIIKNYLITSEENAHEKLRRNIDILKGKNKLKTREYETKSSTSIPNDNSGLRRYANKDETQITKPIVADQNCEQSDFNVTVTGAGDKRFLDGNGTYTPENQKTRRTNEAVTSSFPFDTMAPLNSKVPIVTIFDGYSVAKDVNGENKLTEKAFLIHR